MTEDRKTQPPEDAAFDHGVEMLNAGGLGNEIRLQAAQVIATFAVADAIVTALEKWT